MNQCVNNGECVLSTINSTYSEVFGYRFYTGSYIGVSLALFFAFLLMIISCIVIFTDYKKKKGINKSGLHNSLLNEEENDEIEFDQK